MQRLLIDVGNTDTCVGIADEMSWVCDTRGPTSLDAKSFLDGGPTFQIKHAIVASVVPGKNEEWTSAVREKYGCETVICNAETAKGLIDFDFDEPEKIGADRIADAVAAYTELKQACIVVDFGTATNIEYVDDNGVFQGGILMPGLWSGMKGLSHEASKLFDIRLENPKILLGKNTSDAMLSGLVLGEAARVDGLVERIKEERGDAKVIATGGFSRLVAVHCKNVNFIDGILTLKGLNLILDEVLKKGV